MAPHTARRWTNAIKRTSLLIVALSTCTIHQGSAFNPPAIRSPRGGASPPSSHSSCDRASGERHHLPRRRRRSILRADEEGGDGEAEGKEGARVGDGAGSGMGLDGEWQVVSGQGRKARPGAGGEGVGSVPGQLPERTRDGQDWAEWAKEWREDPQGKADRLVDQWDAEAQASGRGGSQETGKSRKRKSKKKRKGKAAGPARGVVGSGFGGAVRPTKSVPKGLVVSETGGDAGEVVDWSTGQQLAETDRRENMAADWQQDAKHLESLDPSDREKLAEKLRMALGKNKQKKPRKTAPPAGSEGKGFSTTPANAAAGVGDRRERGGDGRGVLASAASAAGAVTASDVGGVAVFPSATAADVDRADPPAVVPADADADADADDGDGSEEKPLPSGVAAFAGDVSTDTDPKGSVETSAILAAAAEEGGAPRGGTPASAGNEVGRDGTDTSLKRVMSFGKGVAVVEPGSSSSSSSSGGGGADRSPPVLESTASLSAGTSAGKSPGNSKFSSVRNFGRGVSVIPDLDLEGSGEDKGAEEEEESAAVGKGSQGGSDADSRLTGFGKGVAFPVKTGP